MRIRPSIAALAAALASVCPARATVTTTTTSTTCIAPGGAMTCNLAFPFNNNSDLLVTLNGTNMVLGTDYTVACAGCSSGGSVTMVSNPTAGASLIVTRSVPYTQLFDPRQGPYKPASFGTAFDTLEMQIQQLRNNFVGQGVLTETSGGTGSGVLTCTSGQVLTSNGTLYSCVTVAAIPPYVSQVLPEANGGSGVGGVTCAAGQVLTSDGTTFSCVTSLGDPNTSRITRMLATRATITTNALDHFGYDGVALNFLANSSTSALSSTLPQGYIGGGSLALGNFQTSTINADAGLQESSYPNWKPDMLPKVTFIWAIPDGTAATRRYNVGLVTNNPGALPVQLASQATGFDYMTFAYEAAAGTNTWFVCSANGTSASCVDTNVSVTTTPMLGTLFLSSSTTLDWKIASSGATSSGTKTTLLPRFGQPSNNAALGMHAMARAVAAVTTDFQFGRMVLQTN